MSYEVTLAGLSSEAKQIEAAKKCFLEKADKFLKGRKITVVDKNWNGQPYGRSWPKLAGKTFEIDHVILCDGELAVWFPGPNNYCYMPISYGVVR
jgi:hypothetical protein